MIILCLYFFFLVRRNNEKSYIKFSSTLTEKKVLSINTENILKLLMVYFNS